MTLALLDRARQHGAKAALRVDDRELSYNSLLEGSEKLARRVLTTLGTSDVREGRIVALVGRDEHYVMSQWATFRCGGVWVPMALGYPVPEMERMLDDSQPAIVFADEAHHAVLKPLCERRGLTLLRVDEDQGVSPLAPLFSGRLPEIVQARAAMMLFTSGTTSRPKGVLTTHAQLTQQLELLTTAWQWRDDDQAVLLLPLHHVHGLVNVLSCGLYAGACVRMLDAFEPEAVWALIERGEVTVLMAVPTLYHRLAAHYDAQPSSRQATLTRACEGVRLMVSGSAALPVPLLERWRVLSGHTLLERYGMTEIGMALSNPYEGDRVAGTVGFPLPSVQARVRSEAGLIDDDSDGEGELEIRGPSVFREYFGREQATREAFTDDGWFLTGDRVRREGGRYSILGRNSVDILKTGGYKVSALEIESVLMEHDAIAACAVVGLPHEDWGEEVWAGVELHRDTKLDEAAFRSWAKARLAAYKVPRRFAVVTLPRNAMGKVVKPDLMALLKA